MLVLVGFHKPETGGVELRRASAQTEKVPQRAFSQRPGGENAGTIRNAGRARLGSTSETKQPELTSEGE